MTKTYSGLHVHVENSNLRLRDSINRVEEVLKASYDKGLKGVCFTDHESLSCHTEVERKKNELREKGEISEDFKVVLGNEIYLIDDIEENKESGSFYHFILMAKNKKGHLCLRKLSNQAWENMFVRGNLERVPLEKRDLKRIVEETGGKGNIIGSTACLGGEFAQLLLELIKTEIVLDKVKNKKLDIEDLTPIEKNLMLRRLIPDLKENQSIKWDIINHITGSHKEKTIKKFQEILPQVIASYNNYMKRADVVKLEAYKSQLKIKIHNFVMFCLEVFGKEDFYIEIQPSLDPEQILFNRKAIDIANAYKIDYIPTTDAHFINEEDIVFQEAFLNAQDGDREVASFYLSCFIHTPEELIERLSKGIITKEEIEIGMENTLKITDKCEEYSLKEKTHVPLVEVESIEDENFLDIIQWVRNIYEGENNKNLTIEERFPFIFNFYNSDNEQDRFFLHLIQEGMKKKHLMPTTERINRIEAELKEIWLVGEDSKVNQKMAQYYILAREIINIMWEDGNSLVGVARGCFKPNTLVELSSGVVKTIKEIKKGEVVKTHKGNNKKVLDTMVYEVEEDMIKIKAKGHNPISSTLDHEYFVLKKDKEKAEWVKGEDIEIGDFLSVPRVKDLENKDKLASLLKVILKRRGKIDIENNECILTFEAVKLAYQVRKALNYLGCYAMIETLPNKEITNLKIIGEQYVTIAKILGLKWNTEIKKYSSVLKDKDYFYVEVIKKDIEKYKGKVYDLRVEDDTSYTANGFGVHNSVGGMFTAYLTDIIQIDPIVHDLPAWRHIHHSKASLADVDIDSEANKREQIIEAMRKHFGKDRVLNICTFGREGTKSTIQTACRGLGVDNATAMYLSSLVPTERGKAWSLKDMFYGNEEKERKPNKEFIKEVEKIKGLKEVMFRFEGLINKRSTHASGVLFYDEVTEDRMVFMRSPSGQKITQWDMEDSEGILGMVKMDFLTIESLDLIRVTLDFLLEYGYIEWQGSLRKTYNKYLHPDVLDYSTEEMWEMLEKGQVHNLFQFTTDLGKSMAIKAAPKSLAELASVNSLMRLSTPEEIQPIDRFVDFRNNIKKWYKECKDFGLKDEEIKILEKHLLPVYGQANTQEDLMEILMNPKISAFSITEADRARRGLAKKKPKDIEMTKELYFKKGKEVVGASEKFLNYVWKYQIEPQLG